MEPREEHIKDQSQRGAPAEGRETKEEYRNSIESRLKEWAAQIEKLREKANAFETNLRVKYDQDIRNLQIKKEELQKRIQEVSKAGGEGWAGLKVKAEKAVSDLKQALEIVLSKYK
jgi:hypothetical protein